MAANAVMTDEGFGLSTANVEPFRYEGFLDDPYECGGIVLDLMPSGARVLDVGCGTGIMSAAIRDRCAADITAIEPHDRRAAMAAARGLNVIHGILDETTSAGLSDFDIVLFADVLEHLPDPRGMLVLARQRCLKPGGHVLLSVPNIAHWTVRCDLLAGRFDYQPKGIMDATHLRWFTLKTIRQTVESAGYKIIEERATAGLWMEQYTTRFGLGLLPARWRRSAVLWGLKHWPELMGCQHVIKAARNA